MTDAYPDGGALATTPGAAPGRGTREPSAARRDGSLGLSFLLLGDTLNALRRAEGPGAIEGMPALDLAKRYASHGGAQRGLGFAAVNAINAQRVALVGPGAACLPDPLFARGVTLLGGSWIIDGAAFRLALASGKPWGAFARKFVLGADGYPGLDRLLERAAGGA